MKSQYIQSLSLFHSKIALAIVLLVLFCGSLTTAQTGGMDSLFIGLVHPGTRDDGTGRVEGYLLVYPATDEFNDGDSVYNVHSSYQIYKPDGKLFKSVENHMSRSDEIPELVSLAAGFYVVEARSADNGYVRVPVVIKPSRRTVVDVDR
jgi:hypothetical protein